MSDWTAEDQATFYQKKAQEYAAESVVRGNTVRLVLPIIQSLVPALMEMRADLRAHGQYEVADRLRAALLDAGVEINDGRPGEIASWNLPLSTIGGRIGR